MVGLYVAAVTLGLVEYRDIEKHRVVGIPFGWTIIAALLIVIQHILLAKAPRSPVRLPHAQSPLPDPELHAPLRIVETKASGKDIQKNPASGQGT